MNRKVGTAVIAMLLALAAAWYFWQRNRELPAPPAPPPQAITPAPPPPPAPSPLAAIRYPLGVMPTSSSLPELGRSDSPFLEGLGHALSHRLLALIFTDEVIRRIVRTVDNLPQKKLPPDAMPLKPLPGALVTTGKGERLLMSRRNEARYAAYVRIVSAVDAAKLVDIYVDFYPLFQSAYEMLNSKNGYFNDRLVEAIDDMLAAPEPAGPLKLVRSDGFFEFADAGLEARSAGQKILIRMGAANAGAIKAKLREIRQEVTQRGRK